MKSALCVEREMKVLYRLKHQHIVAVHGITEWSNCIGIIMEYAEAGNLDDFLWLQGDIADIPLLLKLRFAHQISDGLRYLHHHDKKRSYLHCDLKPQNILLTPDLMVKIADFGSVAIATATGVTGGSFTITSTTQHTPFYTAPELLGDILSDKKPSMDVYSYGMVLYAILTRHLAFSSDEPFSPNPGLITHIIIHCGQKPKQKYLDDVESTLKDKPEDLEIFKFLKDIMVRCWDFEVKNRPDIQQVYDEIDEKLRSLNKSDITYHISDLKKNEEPEPTPSSVKIVLSEFSSPFEVGPQPSTAYLPISEQSSSTSSTSIQDEVNAGSTTITTRESPGIKQGTSLAQIGLVENVQTEQSTSATSIQDEVNEGFSTLTIRESPIQKQIIPKIKPKNESADGAVETASDVVKTSSEQSSSTSATSIQNEVNAGSSTLLTRESPDVKEEISGHLKSIPAAETVKDLKQKNEPADGDDETFQEQTTLTGRTLVRDRIKLFEASSGQSKTMPGLSKRTVVSNKPNTPPAAPDTRKEPADGAGETLIDVVKTSSEQSSSTSATSIQDEVNAGSTTLTTRESPDVKQETSPEKSSLVTNVETGLENMSKQISSINDLISNEKIDKALKACEDLKSAMNSTFVTGDDAIDIGNDIINLMSTLRRKKYSPTILTLLLLAGDLHKQIDDPTEKVELMGRCAFECYGFIVRCNKNMQPTTYRQVISRMTDFVQSIHSVKVDDEKLAATLKAHCWMIFASCHSHLANYSRAIEVLQLAIATFESTFGDGCRKMWLYSACCNNIGTYYANNNQPEEAEIFYIKSFHAHQEVEDKSEQWKMENIHNTINNLCNFYQNHPTMSREKGSDVYNILHTQKHLMGLPRFWNMLSSLRLMILLSVDGDVKSICNELITMATNISPPADQRNRLCFSLRATAELLSSKNDEESAKSLLECVDKFEKFSSKVGESSKGNMSHHQANDDVTTTQTVTEAMPEDKAADGASDDDGRSQGLENMSEKISSINDLISKRKIDKALTVCKSLITTIKTASLTGKEAFDIGNDIINLMTTLIREKYSPTILTLLLLAGDLHKLIDDPTEKVKLMERCALECYRFVVRYNEHLQPTTYRHVLSRMTGFVKSIQSVKIDDEKLVATSKAHCWLTIAECHSYLAEYSRAIEVLQLAIATLESTFGDGCRKMALYSACFNNMGTYYANNNQPEEAEAFYIKSFHAYQEVEDANEQWKMESIHLTINSKK
ncbi:unnamed protein product [Clavelina lepadiformis]|uniref:Protein kinase domain-containing protein n=1 Tax=Clavelina lepadiformis TaxID=159417 RepID=A0ABP0FSE8_CLALP